MVKRGLMSQASPNELRVSRVSYFHNNYAQELREKTPRRKAILRGKFQQLERQHNTQKSLLLPSFLPGGGTQQTFIREGSAPRFNLVLLVFTLRHKSQTSKLSILLRFYFHGVLEQLKTNFQTNFCFKRVLGFVIKFA